jgi:hypothetical protein
MTNKCVKELVGFINPLNAELNPICHLLAFLEGATIVVISRIRVNVFQIYPNMFRQVVAIFRES